MALLFNGMPVAYAMGLFGMIGLYVFMGNPRALMNVPITAYNAIDSQVVIAFPLYSLSGSILSAGKLGPRIFNFTNALVRHLPGGIGIASIIFCGVFAPMTGSSVAVAAAISAIALPEMLNREYSRKTRTASSLGVNPEGHSALKRFSSIFETLDRRDAVDLFPVRTYRTL